MATIEPYQTKQGRRYQVRYRTPEHKQTKKRGFRTKREAELFSATVEVAKASGRYIPRSAGLITVAELAPSWLERKRSAVAPSNFRTLDSAWRVHVEPRWGDVRIGTISIVDIEAWISSMSLTGSGATTIRRAYGVLCGVLDDAVRSTPKRLDSNPARGAQNLPDKSEKRHVYLDASGVNRLASESGDHGTLVLVLAYTGLRWGEAVALKVRDVQFLRRRLTVHENAVQLGVDHAEGPTKGRQSRSVPVPRFVLDEISRQCVGKGPTDLVFPGPGGKYLPRPKSTGGWFAGAVKRANVEKISPHDLRHSCASLAVSAGANVLALARMLGHKDPAVTLRVYSDLFDTDLDALSDVMDQRYSPGFVPKTCPQDGVS